jgi:hypothetical protein
VSILNWAYELARCQVNPGELQLELQLGGRNHRMHQLRTERLRVPVPVC